MKYWEADVKGHIVKANTLKELAIKLAIKPSMIEGVYYRNRLESTIKIRKIVEVDKALGCIVLRQEPYTVSFD
jgi:hypothetical protein